MDNLGIMLFFMVVLIVAVAAIVGLAIAMRKNKKARELFQKIKDKIFWNTFIRFVI